MNQMDNVISVISAPILGINRYRIFSDGVGVCTLVAFYDCPLRCRYCLNNECHGEPQNKLSPEQLLDAIKVDDVYYRYTNGGITFGGGEPLLYPDFINHFCELCCGRWHINIETSLNVPMRNIKCCVQNIDTFIVDLKCYDATKYKAYTGKSNSLVLQNLEWLVSIYDSQKIIVRLPDIPDLTSRSDIDIAIDYIHSLGITNIDRFQYILPDETHSFRHEISYRNGKDICKYLKDLRSKVATNNGLIINQPECTYNGPCIGTCPVCETELESITTYLHILEKHNVKLNLPCH